MSPRQPPESPDKDMHSEILQAVHDALNDITPINDPTDGHQPLKEMPQDAPRLVKENDIDVELDRIEAYLRGPTAFTA